MDGEKLRVLNESDTQGNSNVGNGKVQEVVWGVGSVFRLEIDRFLKIMSKGSNDNAYFEAHSKENLVYTFGSRIDAKSVLKAKGGIHEWYLDSIRDHSNNILHIDYEQPADRRGIYLKTVTYKNVGIAFEYGDRPDKRDIYFAGEILASLTKRLVEVNSFLKGEDGQTRMIESKLKLDYINETSRSSNISLLSQATLCNKNSSCLIPAKFHYADSDVWPFGPLELKAYDVLADGEIWNIDTKRAFADLDADGFNDVIAFHSSGVFVSMNLKGEGFSPLQQWVKSSYWVLRGTHMSHSFNKYAFHLADYDRDGYVDLIVFLEKTAWLYLSKHGIGFLHSERICTFPNENCTFSTVRDMNGDGLPDLVLVCKSGIYICTNKGLPTTGTEIEPALNLEGWGLDAFGEQYLRQFEDLNGDSLPDMLLFANDGIFVSENNEGRFSSASKWLKDSFNYPDWKINQTERVLVDMNADGLPDIVGIGATSTLVR